MSSGRTTPENSRQSMLDASTRQSSRVNVPSRTVPSPAARRAESSAPATTADAGHGHYASSTQDAPSNTRKRRRGSRHNNLSSESAVSDTVNLSEGNERTQRDADTDRPANPCQGAR
ncbi:hypothetical protein MSAN_01833900 [Mycena sanguinolenta]|uniref:Uncharacterized protein n=1 Tax=Mycena sanguinolenta TaxID=230812 RepID=A0A8H7CSQ6_9AGAR|nr:hypothetical protein MSAN_01833900 [Mycena sanguinolenta]